MSAGTRAPANGTAPELTAAQQSLAEAIASEEAIATEAAALREDKTDLDHGLFMELWALARRPIPSGFIQHVGVVTGKPYESDGVRSVQVQHDRMNNVFTPLWWWEDDPVYEQDGKLCFVTVHIGSDRDKPMMSRSSWGGMKQASTLGNLFKGSYTNAAKVAFARVGPGHEVYLGAADFDPDTDEDAAKAQGDGSVAPIAGIPADEVAELVSAYEALKGAVPDADKLARDLKVKLGSMGVPTPSLNRAFAALTPTQRDEVVEYFNEQQKAAA